METMRDPSQSTTERPAEYDDYAEYLAFSTGSSPGSTINSSILPAQVLAQLADGGSVRPLMSNGESKGASSIGHAAPVPRSDDDHGQPSSSVPPSEREALSSAPSPSPPMSPGPIKPLSGYYEHLLEYKNGQLVKPKSPLFLKLRSAEWFLTLVVCIGISFDLIAYTIVVPVLPFRLQELNYNNVAGHVSWLLLAYSAGIFICTFPCAIIFHRYPWRRGPLVIAVLVMEASFILFMLARPYWCMVISRVIQGGCSCVIWTVGFALICENVDPSRLGVHLGFAFSGLSIGATIAPPIGGALYHKLGWKAPFIFCIILCAVDTIARIFILEQKDVIAFKARRAAWEEAVKAEKGDPTVIDELSHEDKTAKFHVPVSEKRVELSPWKVIVALASMPRGLVAFQLVAVFGFIVGCLDSTLPIRMETVWNKDSNFVGLMYLAAASPAFFIGPLAGWLADKYGCEWIILPSVILCLPWLPLMIIKSSLPLFVICFAMTLLIVTVLNSVASLEVAIVAKFQPGISEIHEFAVMNVAFAVSSSIGAVLGGPVYDKVHNGWNVLCWIGFAVFVLCIPPPLIWTGRIPLLSRMRGTPPPRSGIAPEDREYWEKKRRGEDPEAIDLGMKNSEDNVAKSTLSSSIPDHSEVVEAAEPAAAARP